MEKIARLSWNTEGWKRPSGSCNNLTGEGSSNYNVGFSYDEWLFDSSRIIDNYHYGFLRAMLFGHHGYHIYDIDLFTISPLMNHNRIYIGSLRNAVGVSKSESRHIIQIYQEKGWIKEMMDDVSRVGGKVDEFVQSCMFNVKFKFSEAEILYSNPKILDPHSLGHRYHLMNKKSEIRFLEDEKSNAYTFDTRNTVISEDNLRLKIMSNVEKHLNDIYTYVDKNQQKTNSFNRKIDFVAFDSKTNESHFILISTSSARNSLNELLGPIMEYSYYPQEKRADKLLIIGSVPPDESDNVYMENLRTNFNIPIWYKWYSFTDNKLY